MLPFELTILGCSSATPTSSRHPTSQILNIQDRYFLIDCGEATQIQLRRFRFKMQRIDHIFISHLHGDHYLGLPGLLSTMHLLGRTKDVHIYSPPGLKEIIDVNHHHSQTYLGFQLHFHILEGSEGKRVMEDDLLEVEQIPMNHRIPCYGFLFREKPRLRNIVRSKITELEIPVHLIPGIKQGDDFVKADGTRVPNEEITLDPLPPRVYAYCSDTRYIETYCDQIRNSNLIYHEATFTEDFSHRAKETHHCTAREAGEVAKKAEVQKMIIGHFSARYKDLDQLLEQAKATFPNTVLAEEGATYPVE